MTTKQIYVYEPTTTYISSNAPTDGVSYEEYVSCISTQDVQKAIVVDSSAALDYNAFGSKSGEHINYTTAQINVDDVVWLVNNYELFPEFGGVTVEKMKNGEAYEPKELLFSSINSSVILQNEEGKITYSNGVITNTTTGIYYDIKHGTTNAMDSSNYDSDKNNIPDARQWDIV